MLVYSMNQSMLLTCFLFLFKFRMVEIQIDKNARTVAQILRNLIGMERRTRLSFISILLIKVLFITCYSMANIIVIIDKNSSTSHHIQLIMKTVLISINIPCNIILTAVCIYFYKMGLRFLNYINEVSPFC